MLKMRCNVMRLSEVQVDGLLSHTWAQVVGGTNVRCFLDLNFIRAGKDPVWTPDTKTGQNRKGVLFISPKVIVQPGDRIQMTKGPAGTFKIDSSVDEAWKPAKYHHQEVFVEEVDRVLAGS